MTQVITYLDGSGQRVVVYPAPNSGLSIGQLAARTVPPGTSWQSVDIATVEPTADEILTAWRAGANAYRRAFRKALGWLPVSWAPTLNAAPSLAAMPSLLVAADAYVATLGPYDPLRQAWEDVYEFLRTHPDMLGTQGAMQITDLNMDKIFRACKVLDTPGGTDNAARAELGLPPL
jgi:hypothetical protein